MHLIKLERLKYMGHWPQSLLDIGAHVGAFSSAFTNLFPGCAATLIEANPHCEPFLRQSGHPYYRLAASNRRGTAQFNLNREDLLSTGSSLYRENTEFFADDKLSKIEVELMPLDELFPGQSFDFIKIDVQGAELDVIRGAPNLLRRAEHVLLELSLLPYNAGAPLADVVIAAMSELGFRLDEVLEYHRLQSGTLFQLDFLFAPRRLTGGQRIMYSSGGDRSDILAFLLTEQHKDPGYTILELGDPAPHVEGPTTIQFAGDPNQESDWALLAERAARRGRFSYALCLQVLEYLARPSLALKYLPMVADAGIITLGANAWMGLVSPDSPLPAGQLWQAEQLPSGQLRLNPVASQAPKQRRAGRSPGEVRISWRRTLEALAI